jgi:hypothetical protein
MSLTFNLPDSMRQAAQDILDSVITNGTFSRDCTLYYPPKQVPCPCTLDKSPSGMGDTTFLGGNNIPLPAQFCAYCGGSGKKAEEVTESIKMHIIWKPPQFLRTPTNEKITVPTDAIMSRGFLTDLPKIRRCVHIVADNVLQNYMPMKYKLFGQPWDLYNYIQHRYFVAIWQQI